METRLPTLSVRTATRKRTEFANVTAANIDFQSGLIRLILGGLVTFPFTCYIQTVVGTANAISDMYGGLIRQSKYLCSSCHRTAKNRNDAAGATGQPAVRWSLLRHLCHHVLLPTGRYFRHHPLRAVPLGHRGK